MKCRPFFRFYMIYCVAAIWVSGHGLCVAEESADLASRKAARIQGHEQCVDCHRSEYKQWRLTKHANETFDMLRNDARSKGFAEKLNIKAADIAKSSVCINCHATPQIDANGHWRVIAGVACEQCHGPSGGDKGWLNTHAFYGFQGAKREDESPEHKAARQARCTQAGMVTSNNLFQLARACYQCHTIWDEKLVNVAEHPPFDADFEFVKNATGEIRHNFHVDQSKNAMVTTLHPGTVDDRLRMMYLAGQYAKLHVGLTNLEKSQEAGNFRTQMYKQVTDATKDLDEVIKNLLPVERHGSEFENLQKVLRKIEADYNSLLTLDPIDKELSNLRKSLSDHDGAANAETQSELIGNIKNAVTSGSQAVAGLRLPEGIVDEIQKLIALRNQEGGNVDELLKAAESFIDTFDNPNGPLKDVYVAIDDFVVDYTDAENDDDKAEALEYLDEGFEEAEAALENVALSEPLVNEIGPPIAEAFERMANSQDPGYVQNVKKELATVHSVLLQAKSSRYGVSADQVKAFATEFFGGVAEKGSELGSLDDLLKTKKINPMGSIESVYSTGFNDRLSSQ